MKRKIVIGLGASQSSSAQEATEAAARVLSEAGLEEATVIAVGAIRSRAEHPAIHAVASHFGAPVEVFEAARLEEETPRLANPSPELFAKIGCHGVAEAAALAAAGRQSVLLVEKTKSGGVTVAIAEARAPGGPS